jgi:hypothetical protein
VESANKRLFIASATGVQLEDGNEYLGQRKRKSLEREREKVRKKE